MGNTAQLQSSHLFFELVKRWRTLVQSFVARLLDLLLRGNVVVLEEGLHELAAVLRPQVAILAHLGTVVERLHTRQSLVNYLI